MERKTSKNTRNSSHTFLHTGPLQGNAVATCAILATACATDALSAIDDGALEEYAPGSFRTTCIVLVAFAASPPIRDQGKYTQLLCTLLLLCVVSSVSARSNSLHARLVDAPHAFGGVVLLSLLYAAGLFPKGNSNEATVRFQKREVVRATAAALLVHLGTLMTRNALMHPWDVSAGSGSGSGSGSDSGSYSMTSEGDDLDDRLGYAFASTEVSATLVFGGVIAAMTGLILAMHCLERGGTIEGISHPSLREDLQCSSTLQLVCATIATLAQAQSMGGLPEIFSSTSCSERVACRSAFLARRNAIVSISPFVLWLTLFATETEALEALVRVREGRGFHRLIGTVTPSLIFGVAGVAALAWRMEVHSASFCDDGGGGGGEKTSNVVQHRLLLGVIATAACIHGRVWFGATVFLIALTHERAHRLMTSHITMRDALQPTDAFLYVNCAALLVCLLLCVDGLDPSCSLLCTAGRRVQLRRRLRASVATFGASSAALLYLLSVTSTAAASGALFTEGMLGGNAEEPVLWTVCTFESAAANFVFQHYLPLLVWRPLLKVVLEEAHLARCLHWTIHLAGGLAPGVWWAVSFFRAGVDATSDGPTAYVPSLADESALAVAISCSVITWVILTPARRQ
jgi:hypothetical protein